MRIKCNKCDKVVSTEVPKGTIVRAWVECTECMELRYDKSMPPGNLSFTDVGKRGE